MLVVSHPPNAETSCRGREVKANRIVPRNVYKGDRFSLFLSLFHWCLLRCRAR